MSGDNKDIFRDTPIRFLGYANEVGEAFRPLISRKLVNLSYGVATAYVLADTASKSSQKYNETKNTKKALIEAGDVLIWQMFASVFIPGFVINRITWATGKLCRVSGIRGPFHKIIPTAIGLASIPFIIKPIDENVDILMDKTYRNYLKDSKDS